jgi:hypothetical protein
LSERLCLDHPGGGFALRHPVPAVNKLGEKTHDRLHRLQQKGLTEIGQATVMEYSKR